MSYKIQSSFAAGELDPALRERTTLDKYKTGLGTERNWFTGKTGRLISRPGTCRWNTGKTAGKKFVLFAPPYTNYLVEWGHLYARVHNLQDGTFVDRTHAWTEDDLPYIQFSASPDLVYAFREGKVWKKLLLDPGSVGFLEPESFNIMNPPSLAGTQLVASTLSGTGYQVDYVFTYVVNGREEAFASADFINVNSKLPLSATEQNAFDITINTLVSPDIATEVRIYRRPHNGNVYGYVGASSTFTVVSTFRVFKIVDFGVQADYAHTPPDYDPDFASDSLTAGPNYFNNAKPRAGFIYQKRLIFSGTKDKEAIFASRPNIQTNFTKNNPVDAASALVFKSGTSGSAKVLRFADLGGLAAFTTAGVYMNERGALTPDNITMIQRGNWVIDPLVPPLRIPGAIIFIDSLTNSVVALNYSDEQATFDGQEISVYSNHLFLDRKVSSWAFQDGVNPLIWIVYDDGTLATLTYQNEQLVRSWARSDSQGSFFSVTVYKDLLGVSKVYFGVDRDGVQVIEFLSERRFSDIKEFIGMDSTVTFKKDMFAESGGSRFTLVPVTPGVWDGPLTLTAQFGAFADDPNVGEVGTIFRYFTADKNAIDLTVTTYTSATVLVVQPSNTFPSAEAVLFTGLYQTANIFDGLDHLEGQEVSVLSDGFVESSPLNVVDPSPQIYTVTGGEITFANDKRGAIVHIGLPYAQDIETLDVDTVEQKPTLLESINCKRLNIKFYNSRGCYFGNEFPSDQTNAGMINPEYQVENPVIPNLAPVAQQPYTRRVPFDIDGSWSSQGRVCIRNVDPLPVEILSIIPDLEIYWR